MTDEPTVSAVDTNQVTTTDLPGAPEGTPNVPPTQPATADGMYAPEGPNPEGTSPAFANAMEQDAQAKGDNAPGVESEEVIWEARYSLKNFIGRILFRTILTVGWLALAIYTWESGHTGVTFFTVMSGVFLVGLWLALLYRIVLARFGHEYRLTNRRLFVTTGLLRRRRDQMELLRVKDVFTRHTLVESWLSLGTVVVVSNEPSLPTFYLAGVNDPTRVMDLVWHCARAERDGKTAQIENL